MKNVVDAAIEHCTKQELAGADNGAWEVAEEAFKAGVAWLLEVQAQEAMVHKNDKSGGYVLDVAQTYYGGGKEGMMKRTAFVNGASWKEKEYAEAFIPPTAFGFDVFAIKDTENGKEAFIGYFLPNMNFHFVSVPYTEKPDYDKWINNGKAKV